VPGIAPRHPPTPLDVRFSASSDWTLGGSSIARSQPAHPRHSRGLGDFFVRPVLGQSGIQTAVVRFRCFVCWFMPQPERGVATLHPSALRSSPLSRGFFTTMASADFLWPLSQRISLGQCPFCLLAPLGSTYCRQCHSGFVFASTLAPDSLPLCPFVFLQSSICLRSFRAASLRSRPDRSATVGVTSPRRKPFIPQGRTPAKHTSASFPTCCIADFLIFKSPGRS